MPKSKKKKKETNKIWELYKVEKGSLTLENKMCPKCGAGVFLAKHDGRESCGKCGYTEFKGKNPKKA
jgi:small subunit ribosomal protein S27Ae